MSRVARQKEHGKERAGQLLDTAEQVAVHRGKIGPGQEHSDGQHKADQKHPAQKDKFGGDTVCDGVRGAQTLEHGKSPPVN